MSLPLAVTSARTERAAQVGSAHALAWRLGVPYVRRRGRTVARLMLEEDLAAVVVVNETGPVWHDRDGGTFAFHPNMAIGRLRALRRGARDPLLAAAGMETGDRVLDATLGLGADAIVASWAVGPTGLVVGLEASRVLAVLVADGLATYQHALAEPMRRVQVILGDHRRHFGQRTWLARAGWDVILFDPMFERPVERSRGLDGLRRLACYAPLTAETIAAARTLVTKAVVVKTRRDSSLLTALPSARVVNTRGSVAYAVYGPESW